MFMGSCFSQGVSLRLSKPDLMLAEFDGILSLTAGESEILKLWSDVCWIFMESCPSKLVSLRLSNSDPKFAEFLLDIVSYS